MVVPNCLALLVALFNEGIVISFRPALVLTLREVGVSLEGGAAVSFNQILWFGVSLTNPPSRTGTQGSWSQLQFSWLLFHEFTHVFPQAFNLFHLLFVFLKSSSLSFSRKGIFFSFTRSHKGSTQSVILPRTLHCAFQ